MLNQKEIEKLQKKVRKDDTRLPIIFSALGDQRRCLIFRSFLKHDKLCVSDISKIFDMSMSLASQHLKILEITGLLTRTREGRTVYYSPNLDNDLTSSIIQAVQ